MKTPIRQYLDGEVGLFDYIIKSITRATVRRSFGITILEVARSKSYYRRLFKRSVKK